MNNWCLPHNLRRNLAIGKTDLPFRVAPVYCSSYDFKHIRVHGRRNSNMISRVNPKQSPQSKSPHLRDINTGKCDRRGCVTVDAGDGGRQVPSQQVRGGVVFGDSQGEVDSFGGALWNQG